MLCAGPSCGCRSPLRGNAPFGREVGLAWKADVRVAAILLASVLVMLVDASALAAPVARSQRQSRRIVREEFDVLDEFNCEATRAVTRHDRDRMKTIECHV